MLNTYKNIDFVSYDIIVKNDLLIDLIDPFQEIHEKKIHKSFSIRIGIFFRERKQLYRKISW